MLVCSSAAEESERATAANVAQELAALSGMTGSALAVKFEELFGRPPRSRNRAFLRKRVAWEIQARIEGGLSEKSLQRIDELAAYAPERWRWALDPKAKGAAPAVRNTEIRKGHRDARLPSPGTVISRTHRGVDHRVTVLESGFEYRGQRYRSLSKIARDITSTPWNGFLFFFGRSQGTKGRTS